MVSWRDDASPQAQQDADTFLSTVLEVAGARLVKDGGFYPFGAAHTTDGELVLLDGDPDLGDQPSTDDVLRSLYDGTEQRRGDYRSVALAADVTDTSTGEERAGVRVEMEHQEGTALVLLVPYTRTAEGQLTYGEMEGAVTTRRVWQNG
jgi:hypothetical protein